MSDDQFHDAQVNDAPPWLQQPYGRRWNFALGMVKEAFFEACKQAVKARHPKIAPVDALERIGRERGIDRGFFYTLDQYRVQLVRAFDYWSMQGTAEGLISALNDAGYPNVGITENYTADGIGPDEWSWFFVQFRPPYPWSIDGIGVWNDAAIWNDDQPWADPMPAAEADRVRAIIRRLKPKHAKCAGAQFMISGQLWGDPARIWGAGLTWDAVVMQIDV